MAKRAEAAVADNAFIDVDHAQCSKHRQSICGDVVLSHRIKEEGRDAAKRAVSGPMTPSSAPLSPSDQL